MTVVWLDARTKSTVEQMLSKVQGANKDFLKKHCGLPISTYFSALKLRWLIDNIPEVQEAIAENRCLFGTVDTWLIWVIYQNFLFVINQFKNNNFPF